MFHNCFNSWVHAGPARCVQAAGEEVGLCEMRFASPGQTLSLYLPRVLLLNGLNFLNFVCFSLNLFLINLKLT